MAQRLANTQPGMRCFRLGTTPGISASLVCCAAQRGAELRHRAEQPLRVGVARGAVELGHRRLLHLAARVHHHHPLGHLGDDAEIVRDQDDGGADLGLQVLHQVEDLRLDGDVERRGRLVGDQQLGPAGQRDGDHHALAHAAGELVGILVEAALGLGDADQLQHLHGPVVGLAAADALVQPQRLAELPADGQHGIEARHRLLEDHGDVVAAHAAASRVGELQQVDAAEADGARDLAGRLGDQAQDGVGGHRLAAARFTHHRQRLALLDVEGDAVDRPVHPVRGAEVRLQVLDLEQRHGSTAAWPCAGRACRAGRRPAG